MTNTEITQKIKKWREVARKVNDYFIKFIIEYIAFNALARQKYGYVISDSKLVIDKVGSSVPYEIFKKEDLENLKKLMPLKNVRNVKRNQGEKEIKKEDLENVKNVVKAIYWIRNNLLHGDKKYSTSEKVYSRDAALVKVGYKLLLSLNDWLLEEFKKGECQ